MDAVIISVTRMSMNFKVLCLSIICSTNSIFVEHRVQFPYSLFIDLFIYFEADKWEALKLQLIQPVERCGKLCCWYFSVTFK